MVVWRRSSAESGDPVISCSANGSWPESPSWVRVGCIHVYIEVKTTVYLVDCGDENFN